MNIACNLQSHDGMQNAKNAAFMWMCRRRAPGNQNQYYRHDDHSGLISSTKFLGKKRINRTSNGMVLGASSSSSRLDASTTTSTSSSTPTSKVKVKRKTKKRVAKNSASAKNNASLDTNTRATTATISPRKVKRKTAKPKAARKRKKGTPTTPTPTASTEANVKTRKNKSKKKKKARAKRKKADPKDEPVHFYRNHTDTITIRNSHESESDSAETTITTRTSTVTKAEATIVKFKVRGNPAPLARHRTYRGFIFNPSAKKQKQFCDVVLDMLPLSYFHPPNANSDSNAVNVNTITKGTENVIPIFQEQVISVQIISRMKRPQKHFLANRPGPGRLRQPPSDPDQDSEGVGDKPAHVASHLQVTRTDVDNLAKFVLDSLNGVIYTDDKQVASLTVTKVYDDEEPWTGSTDVIIKSMTMEDLNGFLEVDL